jgi:hypothetical protein
MTAADRAWVAAVAQVQKKIDEPFTAQTMTLTRAKMTQLETAAGGCSRKMRRLGLPSSRLQSVYAMATKACQTYKKAARCFAKAASVSGIDGGTFAGTPRHESSGGPCPAVLPRKVMPATGSATRRQRRKPSKPNP